MIIVETNVVSELMKPSPCPGVVEWLLDRDTSELFTTSITLAEVLYGIARLPEGHRTELLHAGEDGPAGRGEHRPVERAPRVPSRDTILSGSNG